MESPLGIEKSPAEITETIAEERYGRWINLHERGMDTIRSDRAGRGRDRPHLERPRRKRPFSLTAYDRIRNRPNRPLRNFGQRSVDAAILKNPIQVEDHPPNRVVAMPSPFQPTTGIMQTLSGDLIGPSA